MEQNKTGKYIKYAIGEIMLVMIGILLALQVNTWREQHQKTKLEKKTVGLLIRDLKHDNKELVHFRNLLRKYDKNLKRLLLEIEKDNNADTIVKYTQPALRSYLYRPHYPTYQGLIQNGNLDLISKDAIRDSIITYFGNTITYLNDLRNQYRLDNSQARESMTSYIGWELAQDTSWAFTANKDLNTLKNDFVTKTSLSRLGIRTEGFGRRLDSIFIEDNNKMTNLLTAYLNELEQ